MGEKKDNRRVRYTKMVLRESLLELLKTKPINRITVTDLCAAADLNRGTFYTYYRDAYDLLEQIENDFFNEISDYIVSSENAGKYPNFVFDILAAVEKNREFCNILFSPNGDEKFLIRTLESARPIALNEWRKMRTADVSDQFLDYMYTFIANGAVGIIRDWLVDTHGITPTELTMFIMDFSTNGIEQFLSKKQYFQMGE